jgi:hypothetical protein
MCKSEVKPLKPLFYRCAWIITGRRDNGTCVTVNGKAANHDRSETYDELVAGQAHYQELFIEAQPLEVTGNPL